jgi:hypothetical protein
MSSLNVSPAQRSVPQSIDNSGRAERDSVRRATGNICDEDVARKRFGARAVDDPDTLAKSVPAMTIRLAGHFTDGSMQHSAE